VTDVTVAWSVHLSVCLLPCEVMVMMMLMMMMMVTDDVFSSEIRALYPNKFIQYDEQRIYILNTLFNLPGDDVT